MRDIIQKVRDTDKQLTLALLQSVWLSYLLSIGSISAGVLSIFSVAAILPTEPAQATLSEQSASLPDQTVEEEQASHTTSCSSEHHARAEDFQDLVHGEPFQTAEADFQTIADITRSRHKSDRLNLHVSKAVVGESVPAALSVALTSNADIPYVATTALSTFQTLCVKDDVEPELSQGQPEQEQVLVEDESTTVLPTLASEPTADISALNSVERNVPEQLAVGDEPISVLPVEVLSPTVDVSAQNSVEGNVLAQTTVEDEQETPSRSQNSPQRNEALSPSLVLQGVYLNQGDSSARARLTGIYPVSPNALFGGTVDLTTGDGFSDSPGGGLELNELYFTGSLPSLPNLRMSVGLLDLTSYFDRNSFAKDATTHFFNPVFQTNPALAAAGISSRPGVLLNWNVTDNVEAKAAAFSSARNLGDFALDAFAGEVGVRFGNAIVRGTFASARDAGRESGFEEIFQIPRDDGEFGLESDDRENSYGINAEYFIPQLKMGLFGRYGHYDNTAVDKGGDTYSLGLNFLDLFMQDDRLGFGYGRDLSNNELRRERGNKVPDVWELFYDFRLSPNLRAGVTLQARDEFSDVIAGFRVKTELDVLGRLFR